MPDVLPTPLSRGRRTLIWTLLVAATVIAVAAVLTTWVRRQMLDEQSWRDASAELIADPAIRQPLSVYLVNELYDNVNVASELESRLPPDLKPLAGPAAGALRQAATDGVGRLLEAPRVQQLWVDASSLAQQKLVNVLEDKTGHGISTGDGVVTLDLSQLVAELGTDLGLSPSVMAKIPPNTGVITVMRSDQLATAQAAVQALRILSTVLFVLVFVMYALAIYLARGERRVTLRNVGWALIIVGLVALVARRITGRYAVDALASPAAHGAAERAWLIGSGILGEIGWAGIAYGVVIVAGAVLAGPTRHATAVRARLAPVLNERPGIAWATVTGVYLLLILWGPTHALRTVWGVVLLGALLAAGVAVLRAETLREF